MKTENNTEEKSRTTTIPLTIPKTIVGYTIETLCKSKLNVSLMGVDVLGNTIVQISYYKWQKHQLNEIINHMKATEFLNEVLFGIAFEKVIQDHLIEKLKS